MKEIALINHGCAKNLVDSELMLGKLIQNGYKITLDETKADIVIINTCSFIHDAEKESVKSIFDKCGKKNNYYWLSASKIQRRIKKFNT